MLFSFNVLAEPVNINKATAKTIAESLKGIGIKKAEAIVKYRKKNGSFKSLTDLSNVHGIGEKTLKSIASDVGLSKGKTSKVKSTKPKKSTESTKPEKNKAGKSAKKKTEKKAKKSKKDNKKKAKKKKTTKKKSSPKTK